jgi:hypothetical protein
MDPLDDLESNSIYVIREAYHRFPRIALLWHDKLLCHFAKGVWDRRA